MKKTMTNIVKFAKDSLLSADEKELRKAGLKDSDGDYRESARCIIYDLEAKERGYNDYDDLKHKVALECETRFSIFELEKLFKKFEKELLETAKKYNKENSKK